MRKKILVTGGTGYIGSHTVVELAAAGYEPIIMDNLSNSSEAVVERIARITGRRPTFHKADCLDRDAVRRVFDTEGKIDGMIHFAASKAVNESVEKPLLYYRNNIGALLNMVETLIERGGGNFVFSSSCTIYGQPDTLPVTEDAPVKPATSPYGNTKQIAEEILRDTAAVNPSLKVVLLRYFNPVGAHPSAEIGESPNGVPMNLVPYLVQVAAGVREKLRVFGDDYGTPDGSCIRDYIHVSDLAKAHVKAFERMEAGRSEAAVEAYNIGTGRGLSVLELIGAFERATGVKVPYEIAPRREGDIEQIWADPRKAQEKLGWKAETDAEEMMRSAWAWQLKLGKEGIN